MLELALVLVSIAGLLLSLVTWRMMVLQQSCGTSGACDVVFSHPSARLFGFPNAAIAAGYFAAMIPFGLLRRQYGLKVPLWPALAAGGVALLICAWLAWILLFRLRRT